MNSSMVSLTYLIQTAGEVNARLLDEVSATEANFEVTVELSDGNSTVYQLNLVAEDHTISAKEIPPNKLPAYCPERHINRDSTFCIYWEKAQDLSVKDIESALEWWKHLLGYLARQVRAARRRAWPGKEWAHGIAAYYQMAAEDAAKALGEEYVKLLIQKQLTVKSVKLGDLRGPAYRLYIGRAHVCTLWKGLETIANKRQPCLCKPSLNHKSKRIRSCGDHAQQIKNLINGIYSLEQALEDFWAVYKGLPCCKTMDNCPLNTDLISE